MNPMSRNYAKVVLDHQENRKAKSKGIDVEAAEKALDDTFNRIERMYQAKEMLDKMLLDFVQHREHLNDSGDTIEKFRDYMQDVINMAVTSLSQDPDKDPQIKLIVDYNFGKCTLSFKLEDAPDTRGVVSKLANLTPQVSAVIIPPEEGKEE